MTGIWCLRLANCRILLNTTWKGTMVKDWNFYFDRSFYECKDYNLLFSKARSFGQVLDLAMDDQYIYILYLDQLLSRV